MPRYREEVINIKLAEILNEIGFEANGEIISKGKLPDVIVNLGGIKINIEGRFESSGEVNKLKEKCRKRIEEGICDIAIGVIYPQNLREAKDETHLKEKIKITQLKFFITHPTSQGIKELTEKGKIENIVQILTNLYGIVISNNILNEEIEKVGKSIEESSKILATSGLFFSSEVVVKKLRNVLGIKEK